MEIRPILCTHNDLGDAFQKFYAELNLDPFDDFGLPLVGTALIALRSRRGGFKNVSVTNSL